MTNTVARGLINVPSTMARGLITVVADWWAMVQWAVTLCCVC